MTPEQQEQEDNTINYTEFLKEAIDKQQGIVENRYYTVKQAAKFVSLSETTLKRHIESGNLTARKPKGGRALRIKGEDLMDWMQEK